MLLKFKDTLDACTVRTNAVNLSARSLHVFVRYVAGAVAAGLAVYAAVR